MNTGTVKRCEIFYISLALVCIMMTGCEHKSIVEKLAGKEIHQLTLSHADKSVVITSRSVLDTLQTTIASGTSGSDEASKAFPGVRHQPIEYEISCGDDRSVRYQGEVYISETEIVYISLYMDADEGFQGDLAIDMNLATLSPSDAERVKTAFLGEDALPGRRQEK